MPDGPVRAGGGLPVGLDTVQVDTIPVERGLLRLRVTAIECRELAARSSGVAGRLRAVEVAAGLDALSVVCGEAFGLLAVDLDLVTQSLAAAVRGYAATEASVGTLPTSPAGR